MTDVATPTSTASAMAAAEHPAQQHDEAATEADPAAAAAAAPSSETHADTAAPAATSTPAAAAAAAAAVSVNPADIEAAWAAAKAKGDAAAKAGAAVTADAKAQYESLPREIRELTERLELAKSKLAKMEEVVTRYAGVQEPVVASDGYTYSRGAIEAYVAECKSKGLPAVSHQTKQELKPHFTDNRSLTKLVETLKPMVAAPSKADSSSSSVKPRQAPPQVVPIDG